MADRSDVTHSGGAPLVREELIELFVDAVSTASDCYLRERFRKAGIPSDELPLPISPGGYPMETRPVRYRVERYFAAIDWRDRRCIARVLPIVNEAIGKLAHHPSGLLERIGYELAKDGLAYRDGQIVRPPATEKAQHGSGITLEEAPPET